MGTVKYVNPATGVDFETDINSTGHRSVVVLGNQTPTGTGLMPGDTTNGLYVNVRNSEAKINGVAVQSATIGVSASGDTTIKTAVVGKKIRIHKMFLIPAPAAAAVNISIKSGSNVKFDTFVLPAAGINLDAGPHGWVCETNTNEALILNLSAAAGVRGFYVFSEVA